MRNLLLSLGLSALLAAAPAAGTVAALARNAASSRAQREALLSRLDRAVDGWEAVHAPAAARRVLFLVMADPDSDLLEAPPPPAPFWTALWGLLRSGSARAEHDRRVAALTAPEGAVVLDWYEQGCLWADERRRRQEALAVAVGKARRAGAQVVMLVDGRGAPEAAQVLGDPLIGAADQALVDRLIAVGAGEAAESARVAELISVWHAEGDAVTPAGDLFQRRDAAGRRFSQTLQGQAATPDGAAALVRDLSGGMAADEALKKAGQTPAAPAAAFGSSAAPALATGGAARAAAAAPKPADDAGPLPSIKADSGGSVARAGSVPRGWTAERVAGPLGPIGWTIAVPTADLAPHFAGRTTCAREDELRGAAADAVPAGCHVNVCLVLYDDKPVGELISATEAGTHVDRYLRDDGSEGSLISKVTPSVQFGHPALFFVKSRGKEGRWPAKDVYHYAISAKPLLIDFRYEISGPDPASCGRPYFSIYDAAAHSIAPER